MKVVVLGANGMIGSAMVRVLSESSDLDVFGTIRSVAGKRFFSPDIAAKMLTGVDIEKPDALARAFSLTRPNVVINCIGLTKHHKESDDPLVAVPVNALLPHRIAELCKLAGARFIHVSTDCVFDGAKGGYVEADPGDAGDIYGKSKFLGEVHSVDAITLRTSTIGHELESSYGLLEWFLSQGSQCTGFERAIFSGLPNTVFAEIVRDIVIPRKDLCGLYHVGAEAINKYDLLELIASVYGKSIDIIRDNKFSINRSLDSSRFSRTTGYTAPSWPELIRAMHASR